MKKGKSKVWIFYLLKESGYDGVEKNGVYAYTFSKDKARLFRETRNMEYFYEKSVTLSSKEDIPELLYYHSTRELQMVLCNSKTEEYKTVHFTIVLTRKEASFLEMINAWSDEEPVPNYYTLFDFTFNPDIFTDAYRQALDILLFPQIYHMCQDDDGAEDYACIVETSLTRDAFSYLMLMYGELFINSSEEGDETD